MTTPDFTGLKNWESPVVSRRRRVVRAIVLTVSIVAWVAASLPTNSNGVSGIVARLLVSVAIAAGVRAIYVKVVDRAEGIVAWQTFLGAAVVAVIITVGENQTATNKANADAVTQGVASSSQSPTAVDRCVGANLADWDARPTKRPPGGTKGEFRTFALALCREANREGVLLDTGQMYREDTIRVAKKVVAAHGPFFP